MSVDSKTALCHYNKLFPWAEDVRERAALETCGSSVRMAILQLVQVEKQAKCISLSDQSLTKNCFCTPLWESAVGEKKHG